jgi:hypothetical protein
MALYVKFSVIVPWKFGGNSNLERSFYSEINERTNNKHIGCVSNAKHKFYCNQKLADSGGRAV